MAQLVIFHEFVSFLEQFSGASKNEENKKKVLKGPKRAKNGEKGLTKLRKYYKTDRIGSKFVPEKCLKMSQISAK